MLKLLLIGAALLLSAPAFAQTTPEDPDAPRQTSGRDGAAGDAGPVATSSPAPGALPAPVAAPLPAVPPEDAAPPPHRFNGQIFVSPFGEPFHAEVDAPYPVELWFARVDADHDGALSRAEFSADAQAFFKRLDTNHDGRVDGFENGDYEARIAPEIQPRIGGLEYSDVASRKQRAGMGDDPSMRAPGGRYVVPDMKFKRKAGPYRKGAGAFSFLDEPQPVRSADLDLNFRVSEEEWTKATARRFAALDLNHDGRIDRAELPPTPVQEMAADAEKRSKRGFLGLPR